MQTPSPWCLINSDNIPGGREVARAIILVIVKKTLKNPERLAILLKVTYSYLEPRGDFFLMHINFKFLTLK